MDLTDLLSFVFGAGFGRETNDREDMKNSRTQELKESRSQEAAAAKQRMRGIDRHVKTLNF